ncbi:concanavalin A-like lectin/glucanase [Aureobasidium subglaciale]|nr:concanavalin A-like lectin/glucanase [Aureobasidium subglaciale]
MRSSLPLGSLLLAGLVSATNYKLVKDFSGNNFYNQFDFFTGADPTQGFVNYVSHDHAVEYGLIWNKSIPTWGVDAYTHLDPSGSNGGRTSVRMTSKDSFTHGLFIADIQHMPQSSCGVWPAFWTFGQSGNWPESGEIDIIEFANLGQQNKVSGHTMPGCSISGTSQSGRIQGSDCSSAGDGAGCAFLSPSSSTAGSGFNKIGGGVYAMEWTSQHINVWFFPRNNIPSSIRNGKPDVSKFGQPMANFRGCDLDKYFYNHAIVFDTTFCGTWAGETFYGDGCSASSCVDFVANNPSSFKDAYWAVNYVHVYQQSGSSKAKRDFIRLHAKQTHNHNHLLV